MGPAGLGRGHRERRRQRRLQRHRRLRGPGRGRVGGATALTLADLVEAAYWHPGRSDDPAVRWLVRTLQEAARDL